MLIQPGTSVTRLLCGIPMVLPVTNITDDKIICGDYEFCRRTGLEIDELLEWGPQWWKSGSYLREVSEESNG